MNDYETAYDSYLPTTDFFEDDIALDDDFTDDLDDVWEIEDDEDLEDIEDLAEEDYDMLEMSSSDTVGLYLKEMARVVKPPRWVMPRPYASGRSGDRARPAA